MILDEDEVKAKQLEEEKRKMSALRGDSEEGANSKSNSNMTVKFIVKLRYLLRESFNH